MTKMNDIKKMKSDELSKLVADKREEARSFRFGTGGQNAAAARTAKKDIARALTELKTRLNETIGQERHNEASDQSN